MGDLRDFVYCSVLVHYSNAYHFACELKGCLLWSLSSCRFHSDMVCSHMCKTRHVPILDERHLMKEKRKEKLENFSFFFWLVGWCFNDDDDLTYQQGNSHTHFRHLDVSLACESPAFLDICNANYIADISGSCRSFLLRFERRC